MLARAGDITPVPHVSTVKAAGDPILDDSTPTRASSVGRRREFTFNPKVRKRICASSAVLGVVSIGAIVGLVAPVLQRQSAMVSTARMFLTSRMQLTSAMLTATLLRGLPAQGGVPAEEAAAIV